LHGGIIACRYHADNRPHEGLMKVNAAATKHPEFGLKRDLAGEIP
jgi:hypothetical protein